MNLIFAVAGQSPAGMSNMTTLTAFAPPAGRVRFWKAATGFFGLASAGVFADVALGSEGLGTAVFIAAIPAVFAALSALALRSVVSPFSAPRFPSRMVMDADDENPCEESDELFLSTMNRDEDQWKNPHFPYEFWDDSRLN